ncbi:alcohol dehydrogenase [Coniochaeta ligniaria NRRL 30616]|uniref:Alcohol dehydrogenase n=1 Tax=Coniochaeta ligniaria NRRL 30616 TaxID=1408157 RepID=A0A1J7J938_9PEZI|nr:alcohol dehydrogenase [Coniochaeta ligniaria NRRL 30616]
MGDNSSSSALPARQNALVMQDQGPNYKFTTTETAIPPLKPQEILVKLSVTGICGTDTNLAAGLLGPTHSTGILGHEGVGIVAALGSSVSDAVKIGQRVGVGWIRDACGACRNCVSGEGETRCVHRTFSGIHVPGTLCGYAVVPERYLTPLPEDLAPEVMAPIMCAGVTAYKAVKTAGVIPGSWMLVSGAAGGVGALAVQYARAMGYRVIAVDGGEKRRGNCVEAGAEAYVDFEKGGVLAEVERLTDGGLCAAALVCIGAPAAYEAALSCLGYFGVLVCVGIPPPQGKFSIHPLRLIDSGIRVVGSLVGGRGDIAEAMEFVRRGVVKPKVISIKLEELNEYARKLPELGGKLVVTL